MEMTRQELEDKYVEGKALVDEMLNFLATKKQKITYNIIMHNIIVKRTTLLILEFMQTIRIIEKDLEVIETFRPGLEETLNLKWKPDRS